MSGVKGPIPKRSEERRRVNKPEIPIDKLDVDNLPEQDPRKAPVVVPPADANWHPIALQMYESLEASAMSVFYEPSDWAAAYMMCESISRDMKPQVIGLDVEGNIQWAVVPLKGASLAAYLKAFSVLGVTEGDRRRLSVEVTRRQPEGPAAPVLSIADARRQQLGGAG